MLGIRYRRLVGDRLSAGPMHYLRDGLGSPRAGLGLRAGRRRGRPHHHAHVTSPTRSRSCSRASSASRAWVSGVGLAILAWLVIIGGIKSIGRAAEKLAPAKVFLYLAGGLFVIATHAGNCPRCSP